MKVVVLSDVQELTIEERPMPSVGPGEALVKVEACGICGTDVHAYLNGSLYPLGTVMGHEPAGTLVEVGSGVEAFQPGDRVALYSLTSCGTCLACVRGLDYYCINSEDRSLGSSDQLDGAYAEYIWIPYADRMLVKIPDQISFEEATLADPLATPLHAIRCSRFKPGDAVAVLGAGPIGLLAIQLLKISGASKVICTEVSPQRAAIARALGADEVSNPIEETKALATWVAAMSGGLGVDVAFECSGAPSAFRQSLDFVRPGGQVMALGVIERETPVHPLNIVIKEIDLRGSLACSKHEFELALELLAQGRINTELILSDTVPLDDIEERGFKRLQSFPEVVKILVKA
jgi:(R,R)-butanediol dehydrogenase/meso-butanediol dehydrogenase/diacetyl reductase